MCPTHSYFFYFFPMVWVMCNNIWIGFWISITYIIGVSKFPVIFRRYKAFNNTCCLHRTQRTLMVYITFMMWQKVHTPQYLFDFCMIYMPCMSLSWHNGQGIYLNHLILRSPRPFKEEWPHFCQLPSQHTATSEMPCSSFFSCSSSAASVIDCNATVFLKQVLCFVKCIHLHWGRKIQISVQFF